MTAEQFVAFLVFSVVAAVTPGPSNVMLVAAGAAGGIRGGLPCLLGVVLGMGLMMSLVSFGLGSVVLDSAAALSVLNWCGAAFLLWLSWKIATARGAGNAHGRKPVGFLAAVAFQWVNPKSWIVCVSAAGTYLDAKAGGALVQGVLFGAVFSLAAFPSCLLWLGFGAAVQRLLRNERAGRIFNVAMGLLLAGSVGLILM